LIPGSIFIMRKMEVTHDVFHNDNGVINQDTY
jgi:hypothetical protein